MTWESPAPEVDDARDGHEAVADGGHTVGEVITHIWVAVDEHGPRSAWDDWCAARDALGDELVDIHEVPVIKTRDEEDNE